MNEAKWIIAVSHQNGVDKIWRLYNSPVDKETKGKFPWRVNILCTYETTRANGMPETALLEEVNQLEHRLNEIGQFVFSNTGGGAREIVYYTDNPQPFRSTAIGYPVEVSFEEDPDWQAHEDVLTLFENAPQRAIPNYKNKPRKFRPKRIKPWQR